MSITSQRSSQMLADSIGKRVTIRLREPKSQGFRDIVGILQSTSQLINSRGEVINFIESEIAIWREIKELPDRAGTGAPFSMRILEIEKLSDATWIADQIVNYGKWILRISDGFTMRANSVLPLGGAPYGEPPAEIAAAVSHISQIYREHGLAPIITVPLPLYSALDDYLADLGWEVKIGARYLVNDIGEEEKSSANNFSVEISDQPSHEWLAVQSDFPLEKIMRRYPARYASIRIDGKVIGVGRVATLETWSIVTRLFVEPQMRGKGIARQLMFALMSAAKSDGATKVGLQVDTENGAALALYQSMGFRIHHTYVYRISNEKIKI